MKSQAVRIHSLRITSRLDQGCRQYLAFFLIDGFAHDVSAEDIDDRVQVVKLPADRARQVTDVPAPYLVGCCCHQFAGMVMCCWLGSSAMLELLFLAQDSIHRGFRCQIDSLIGQPRHDLTGRKVAILWRVEDLQDHTSLSRADLVADHALWASSPIFTDALPLPAL